MVHNIWGSHSCGFEELYLLGFNIVQAVEILLMFWRNMSIPFPVPKNTPIKKSCAFYLLHAGFMISLLFRSENGNNLYLRNVG
jgi:hypothetical protein